MVGLILSGCGDDGSGETSTGDGDETGISFPDGGPSGETTGGETTGDGDTTGGETGGGTVGVPDGAVALTFFADDRANESYAEGQIQWTGSFVWDKATNQIEHASSWLPDEREWPVLWDDGPISAGGHEAEGQTAGDKIYSTEVFFTPTEETTFEYGALNEFGRWIWIGPNGVLTVPAGATGRMDAGGVVFPKFGDKELKLTIDLAGLHPEFNVITAAEYDVHLKGTMNSWTPVQILDNGKNGDDAADDGVFTYLHSTKLGDHDGLVAPGQHVQFVFVFALKDTAADDGLEYKFPVDALLDGVSGWSGDVGGALEAEDVILEPDSYGKVKNSTVIISGEVVDSPPTGCSDENPCGEGLHCVDEKCLECNSDYPCAEGFECVGGECIDEGNLPDEPSVSLVDPQSGPASGGTPVTVSGVGFKDGATVWFGTAEAAEVEIQSTGTITCKTPAGSLGAVDVKVSNPDGGTGVYKGGFTYTDKGPPQLDGVAPALGDQGGGTPVTLTGQGFQPGAKVLFGVNEASAVSVKDGAIITCKSPAADAPGPVDVTVQNPDGQGSTKVSAFTYEPGLVNYATLEAPYDLTVQSGQVADTVSGRAYHPGVTEADGAGLMAELGWGAGGSDPQGGGWEWTSATYASQGGDTGNDDVYNGVLPNDLAAGSHSWCFRFSLDGEKWLYADRDGSANGFAPAKAGTLTVSAPPDGLVIVSFEPKLASASGGTTVSITGSEFTAGVKVFFGASEATDVVYESPTLIHAKAPAHAAGYVTVKVEMGGDSATSDAKLAFGAAFTANANGVIDEWPAANLMTTDTTADAWDFNDLDDLYLGYDETHLYLAVSGEVEAANALVIYIDTDYGMGTGTNPAALSDGDGALDNALSAAAITVMDGAFGADYGVGAFGGAGVGPDGLMANVGLRSFDDPTNFGWLASSVAWGADGVEIAIPLSALNLTWTPGGTTLGVFARIVNDSGATAAPYGLPTPGENGAVSEVVTTWHP